MITITLSLIAIVIGVLVILGIGPIDEYLVEKYGKYGHLVGGKILIIIGFLGIITRSFVIIDSDGTGHLKRIFMASDLPAGRIIATDGEKGPQADVLGPGFHFIPFVKVLYEVEELPVINIKEGSLGFLTAKDGSPLRDGQFIANEWPEKDFKSMLDAKYFLTEGKGQKGPQLTVLPPGKYRLNHYLFNVSESKALDVPTGQVAVIRSNVGLKSGCPDPISSVKGAAGARVATPIVPKGCVGMGYTACSRSLLPESQGLCPYVDTDASSDLGV